MLHYTSLGIEKLRRQAENEITLLRCPRDSVVMRILGGWAERRDGPRDVTRFGSRLPNPRRWWISEVDVECPACRRRAERIPCGPPPEDAASGNGDGVKPFSARQRTTPV